VAVALVDGRVSRQTVEIAAALDIPDPDALAPFEDDVDRLIVVGAEPVLELDQLCSAHGDVTASMPLESPAA
jgi:hypothetical protein